MCGLSALSATVHLSLVLRSVGCPLDRELPEAGVLEPAHSMPSRSVVQRLVPGTMWRVQ